MDTLYDIQEVINKFDLNKEKQSYRTEKYHKICLEIFEMCKELRIHVIINLCHTIFKTYGISRQVNTITKKDLEAYAALLFHIKKNCIKIQKLEYPDKEIDFLDTKKT